LYPFFLGLAKTLALHHVSLEAENEPDSPGDNTHPRLCGPFGLCGGVPKPTKATFLCYPPTIDAKVVVNPTPMPGARANPKPWSMNLQ